MPTDPDPRLIDAIAQAIRVRNPVGAAQTAEVAARVVAGPAGQPCPHIVTTDEGTSHCTLAEHGRHIDQPDP
jgi:hypothetical protein